MSFVVRCALIVVRRFLFVGCRSLCVGCYWLFVVVFLLLVIVSGMLFLLFCAACWLFLDCLFMVVCCALGVYVLHVVCRSLCYLRWSSSSSFVVCWQFVVISWLLLVVEGCVFVFGWLCWLCVACCGLTFA